MAAVRAGRDGGTDRSGKCHHPRAEETRNKQQRAIKPRWKGSFLHTRTLQGKNSRCPTNQKKKGYLFCAFFPPLFGFTCECRWLGLGGDSTCLRGNLKREFILRHKRAETRWPQGETDEQTGAWKEREGQRRRRSLSKPISAASYRKQSGINSNRVSFQCARSDGN